MNWEGLGSMWLWPDFKVLSLHTPEENHKKPQSGYMVARAEI
jgi:hypothetical protein